MENYKSLIKEEHLTTELAVFDNFPLNAVKQIQPITPNAMIKNITTIVNKIYSRCQYSKETLQLQKLWQYCYSWKGLRSLVCLHSANNMLKKP